MTGYYITQWDNNEKGMYSGPAKKINAQVKGIRESGLEVKLVCPNHKLRNPSKLAKIWGQIYSRLPFTEAKKYEDYVPIRMPDISKISHSDFIYIRFWWGDYPFGKSIQKLRKQNPNAIIFLEFPDYPYLMKAPGINYLYMRIKDVNCSKKYKRYVDYMVTMSHEKTIYGVPTIHMYNGVDVRRIPKRVPMKKDSSIVLGIVANIQKAHGIDRIIKGLGIYYKKRQAENVLLYIIGGGPELENLKKLSHAYGVENHVVFWGFKYGDELDQIFNEIDIGVDFLALFRDNIEVSSSLKSREYLARGIPVMSAAYLDVCEDFNFNHLLKIEPNETPININRVVDFYHEQYKDGPKKVIDDIRSFAYEHVDAKKTMMFIKEILDRKISTKPL